MLYISPYRKLTKLSCSTFPLLKLLNALLNSVRQVALQIGDSLAKLLLKVLQCLGCPEKLTLQVFHFASSQVLALHLLRRKILMVPSNKQDH